MTCYVVEYLACFQSNGRIWLLVARSVCQFGGRLTVKLSSRTDRVKLSSRTDKISCSTSLLHISIMSAACHIYFIHRSHQPEAQRESVCVCVCACVCARVCVCVSWRNTVHPWWAVCWRGVLMAELSFSICCTLHFSKVVLQQGTGCFGEVLGSHDVSECACEYDCQYKYKR